MHSSVLFFVALVTLCPDSVLGMTGYLSEVSELCCNKGTSYARDHTSRDCSSSVPPDVPQVFGDFCKFAMDQCCKEYFDKKNECYEGIDIAIDLNLCADASSNISKSCCDHCLRGRTTGNSNGICTEGFRRSPAAEDLLIAEAFETCCKNATRKLEIDDDDSKDRVWRKKLPKTAVAAIPSLCEEFAPNELCAHHCIPVPGSYRCECNPGFKLMADEKNCIEVTKNRCKPKNPCQQLCHDNGVTVKCACRRGYTLKSDGKSCEDTDECKTEPSLCPNSTICQNTKGSYKCLPGPKHPDENKECSPGFQKNITTNTCDDINECALIHPPCPMYLCENTIGAYKCGGMSGDPVNFIESFAPVPDDLCPPGFRVIRTSTNDDCIDVDECSENKDDCNRISQFCINTRGSYFCQDQTSTHCSQGFKFDPESKMCEDIDECQDNHPICPHDKLCVNNAGGYDCKLDVNKATKYCPDGMRLKPDSFTCEDIDECFEGTHVCDQHQSCLNTNGSYECRCKVGFKLDPLTRACEDINECATGQNDCLPESQRCDNTVGSYWCIRILPCGTGYILQHSSGACEDIDECALGRDNCKRSGPEFSCKNIPGSFRCIRHTISSSTSTARTLTDDDYYDSDDYYDDNEGKNYGNWTTTKISVNPTTSSTSTQRSEEIFEFPILPVINNSINKAYDQRVQIKPNIFNNNWTDDEIMNENNTEIEDKHYNSRDSVKNTEEILKYSVSKKTNPDVTTPHMVLLEEPIQTDIVKETKDAEGFININTNDIVEDKWTKIVMQPAVNPKVKADPLICPGGFTSNKFGTCVDINECLTHDHACSDLTEICKNNIGGYVCECAEGFRRDLRTSACDPIISSTTSTTTSTTTMLPTSMPDESWIFQNPKTMRKFNSRKSCNEGYYLNATTGKCEDINECRIRTAYCREEEECVNTDGGFRCDCLPNWTFDEIIGRCVPNRDKNTFPAGYANIPKAPERKTFHDTIAGNRYKDPTKLTTLNGDRIDLKCRMGFVLGDDQTCEDIDECASGIAKCGVNQICTNLLGGYSCSCNKGFKQVGDHLCEDIDECEAAGNMPLCSLNADCMNTIGSYECNCHSGYRQAPANDKVCVDVDECAESRPGSLCEQRCNNVWGNYKCSCHRGYRLNADNSTCTDINECEDFISKNLCIGSCINELGSYRCLCPTGYRLSQDKRSCIDIDECETGEAYCAETMISKTGINFCYNIRGSFKCEKINCPPGYRLENKHRCTKVELLCPAGDWDCIHQPSTYSFHYITFVSKLVLLEGKVNLYTMNVPAWPNAKTKFSLRLVKSDAPPTVKEKASINSFKLTTTNKIAVVSIVQSLEGPQSIVLDVTMELFSGNYFAGTAVAKLFIYVSEFEF